jgi:hypothetical protein
MDNVNALALGGETTLSLKHMTARAGLIRSISANATLPRWMKASAAMGQIVKGK